VELLGALLSIVLIDIVLSGDNAVVIGMAAHGLEHGQRRLAIFVGGIGAILFRIALTAGASAVLMLPYLKLVGGVLLAFIAVKLLIGNFKQSELAPTARGLLSALWVILTADAVMSLDNILAVAAAARGHIPALAFGLLLSMGILLFVGSQVASLLDRFSWLNYVGAAVIAWTAGQLVASDEIVTSVLPFLQGPWSLVFPLGACLAVATATAVWRSISEGPLVE
jgi:YjbE family integral membrane protein